MLLSHLRYCWPATKGRLVGLLYVALLRVASISTRSPELSYRDMLSGEAYKMADLRRPAPTCVD